jgi:hypothetical protein
VTSFGKRSERIGFFSNPSADSGKCHIISACTINERGPLKTTITSSLALPDDPNLPFFAYGAFKPGEVAFDQISDLLATNPILSSVKGNLKVRDGLPLFDSSGAGRVRGFLLTFRDESRLQAYEKICSFEPKKVYYWTKGQLSDVTANVLHGKKLDKGRPTDLESEEWSFRMDPVFNNGLDVIKEIADELAGHTFESAPPESFDWRRFEPDPEIRTAG